MKCGLICQLFKRKKMKYKGQLEGFPDEVVEAMLDEQERQGNKRDVSVFEKKRIANLSIGGFSWIDTKEGERFWNKVIRYKFFKRFFARYPNKSKKLSEAGYSHPIFPFQLKYQDAQRIIDMACDGWKQKLSCEWGASIVKRNTIIIAKSLYDEMYTACTPAQAKVFDEIFGRPKPKWTIKDAKDGEPVWFKNTIRNVWELGYSNGTGAVYVGQRKSGDSASGYSEYMKFDPDNLPVNENK
jgi:hypothetical protein